MSINQNPDVIVVGAGPGSGLDPMTIYEVVKASSGGSKALERIPRALIPRDFEPGFKVALMNKDLETFHTIAKELHGDTDHKYTIQAEVRDQSDRQLAAATCKE